MIGFLRDLIQWFFHGSEEQVPEPQQPQHVEVVDQVEDNRPVSEKVFSDIFDTVRGHDILDDMKGMEDSTHRFDKARKDLEKEIRNITPRRIN